MITPLSEVFCKTKRFLKVGLAVRMSPDFVPVPTGNERDQIKQVNKKNRAIARFFGCYLRGYLSGSCAV